LYDLYKQFFGVGERSITKKGGLLLVFLKVRNRGIFLKTGDLSLLYTDYTIITSVMASRMINFLKEIIGPDQKGFLKDRYIEENTRLAYDLMQYYKKHKEGMLLLIDFEKAFDSIEWSYIETFVSKYNFGNDFIKWFKIVYKNAQSCVINNGQYSDFFFS
jgi:hypothetical protein